MTTVDIRDYQNRFMPIMGKPQSLTASKASMQSSLNQQFNSGGKLFYPPKSTSGSSVPVGFSKAIRNNLIKGVYTTKSDINNKDLNYKPIDYRLKQNNQLVSKEVKETLNSSRPDSQEKLKNYKIRSGVSIDRHYTKDKTSSNNIRATPLGGARNSTLVRNVSVNPGANANERQNVPTSYNPNAPYLLPSSVKKEGESLKKNVVVYRQKPSESSREENPLLGNGLLQQSKNNLANGYSNYHAYPGKVRAPETESTSSGRNLSENINTRLLNYKSANDYSSIPNKTEQNEKERLSSETNDSNKGISQNSETKKIDRKVVSHVQILSSPQNTGPPKGLVGLRNIGNTCFMNSILQCLFNAPLFSDYFLRNNHTKEKNPKSKGLADAFASILAKVRSHSGGPSYNAETPSELKSKIAKINPIFSGYDQHDAQELLKAVLEGINDDLNRVTTKPAYKELTADPKRKVQEISDEWFDYMLARDNSVITDLFCGQLLSRTTCMHCNYESLAFDNFWDLALSFTKSSSSKTHLGDMLEQFLKEEELEDLFGCERCKTRRKSKKRFVIWRLPKILVVQLKRFEYTRYRRDKINKAITFPVKSFDLSKYTAESSDSSINDAKYSLFGIVNHGGSLSGGHYTAECMNPYDRKWYDFNDSSVSKTSMRDDEAEGSSPYILFYIKTSCLAS